MPTTAINYVYSSGDVDCIKPEHRDRRFFAISIEPQTKITGQIQAKPQLLQHADESFAVRTVLMQDGGLPVVVEHCLGHGHMARLLGERLTTRAKSGDTCTAKGMTLTLDRHAEQLVLVGCTHLFLSDLGGQPT